MRIQTPHDSIGQPHAYEGFELLKHKGAMIIKMALTFFFLAIFCAFVLFFFLKWPEQSSVLKNNILSIVQSCLLEPIWPHKIISLTLQGETGHYYAVDVCRQLWSPLMSSLQDSIFFILKITIIFFLFFGTIGTIVLRKRAQKTLHDPKHVRGARLVEPLELARKIRKDKAISQKKAPDKLPLTLGEKLIFPPAIETQHILILGAVGTGKTNAINHFLKKLREREEKILLFDIKGDYCQKFYDPEIDFILNPLDQRYCGWNFLLDICNLELEAKDVASTIIPPPKMAEGTEKYFRDAGADVLSVIIKYLKTQKDLQPTPEEITKLIALGPTELRDRLKAHPSTAFDPGIAHIAKSGAEGQIGGIMSTLAQFTRIFSLMDVIEFTKFSLRNWFKEDGPGIAFLTLPPAYENLLSNYYSMIINLLTMEALTWNDDLLRRRYIIVDELPALPRITAILRLIREGRSKGISMIVGSQTIQAIREKYGTEGTGTILDINTRIFFRVNNPQDTEILAKIIGETELEEGAQIGHSMTAADDFDRVNANRRVSKKYVLLPTQIAQLPDLTSIIKIAHFDPTITKWNYLKLNEQQPAFIPSFTESQTKDQDTNHQESQESLAKTEEKTIEQKAKQEDDSQKSEGETEIDWI